MPAGRREGYYTVGGKTGNIGIRKPPLLKGWLLQQCMKETSIINSSIIIPR